MIIPNLKIQNILNQLIALIVIDYETKIANNLEEECWLYRVFNGVQYGNYNFYTQAKEVIINRNKNNAKKLEVKIGWNQTHSHKPSIHIIAPQESIGEENSIGMSEDTNLFYSNEDGTSVDKVIRSYVGTYELMIMSDNENESELIYRFLQALFQSAYMTLQNSFSGTFDFTGKQVMFDPETLPYGFVRVFVIKINNTIEVPKFTLTDYLNNVRFNSLMIEENG